MTMHAQVYAVHAAIRTLSAHEAELKQSPTLRQLHPVWQYVVDNSMPPTVRSMARSVVTLWGG